LSDSEISNTKHQIPNKSQIPISNAPNRFGILNFAPWDFFVICDLEFSPEIEEFFVWSNAGSGTAGLRFD
jgi:hypothetical protein